jgi:hypothetical protein
MVISGPSTRTEEFGLCHVRSTEHAPERLTWAFVFLRCVSPVFVAMEELQSASGSCGVSGRVRAHADERVFLRADGEPSICHRSGTGLGCWSGTPGSWCSASCSTVMWSVAVVLGSPGVALSASSCHRIRQARWVSFPVSWTSGFPVGIRAEAGAAL